MMMASFAQLNLILLATATPPQRIIVDTDMGFDVDDAVAVCLANALHMAGKAEILAVVHNTGCALGIGGVSAMNHFYHNDDIIIGAWKGRYGKNCDKHYEGTLGQNQVHASGDCTQDQNQQAGTQTCRQHSRLTNHRTGNNYGGHMEVGRQ